jgi:Arc/MetJ-type ribon-helix-helix transcriptional regulator
MADDTITITLSDKAHVDWIRNKVRDGHFASEAEAVATGISNLREQDGEVEEWIKDTVIPRYERHLANPAATLSVEEVEAYLTSRRKERVRQAG